MTSGNPGRRALILVSTIEVQRFLAKNLKAHVAVPTKIKARLPGFPLVMHGSSSVPKEEVDRINAAGGTIAGSMGVDAERISSGRQARRDQGEH